MPVLKFDAKVLLFTHLGYEKSDILLFLGEKDRKISR